MKFWEAVEHIRKHGGKVRRVGYPARLIAQWNHIADRLEFGHGGEFLVTGQDFNYDWEIVEPPPKEYTFMEAFAMMEQGKWMQPVYPSLCPVTKIGNGNWSWRKSDGSVESFGYRPFEECHIKCKWIEAK